MPVIRLLFAFALLTPTLLFSQTHYEPSLTFAPPAPVREFRGAWITVVATNADWPSHRGMSSAEQRAELIALLDRAAQLKFNAVFFQIRPASDALYASSLEPWSEYLTGTMGRAPSPYFDPLAVAVEEAHKRGLELHAWFNPFRALHPLSKSPVASNHIARTHPELVRRYDEQVWLDPGEPAVRDHVLRVIMDVVQRYDVDGVIFDDYFYPYPKKNTLGRELSFPDEATWRRYGAGLSHEDWRRATVNQFVQNVQLSIHSAKPWVKFGISPFGIWRPFNPPQIRGLDAYAKLYADSRLWLGNGWVDYLSPQLYWPIAQREQSFPALLQWWTTQNVRRRHLWPALNDVAANDKFTGDEIAREIQIARSQPGVGGEVHFHLRTILQNPGLFETIRSAYSQNALVPASPWLNAGPMGKPRLVITPGKSPASPPLARWDIPGGQPRWWLFQSSTHGTWATAILPAAQIGSYLNNPAPEIVSVRAVDRAGNLGTPAVMRLVQNQPAPPPVPVVQTKRPIIGAPGPAPQFIPPSRPVLGPYTSPRMKNR